jgi:hypothetical protein
VCFVDVCFFFLIHQKNKKNSGVFIFLIWISRALFRSMKIGPAGF